MSDEESLKTFCYLCSAIEGVFDDFGELVKWHLIHIVTDFLAATKLLKISHLTMTISDPDKRSFYEKEAINSGWSTRELKRQISTSLYERLLL